MMASPRASPNSAASVTDEAPQKLKESCDDCSISKVKCTREKPACQRCVRRNRPCVYGASRRSGRTSLKHFNSAADDGNERFSNGKEPQNDLWQEAMASALASDSLINNFSDEWFPQGDSWSGQTQTQSPPSSVLCSTAGSSVQAGYTNDASFFDLLSDGGSTTITPSLFQLNATSTSAGPSVADEMFVDSTPVAPVATMLPSVPNNDDDTEIDAHDSCLITTMKLVRSIFPQDTLPGAPCLHIDAVREKNGKVIEVVTSIMDCPCSRDQYLTFFLGLVLLKAMAWYAAVIDNNDLPMVGESCSAGARRGRHGSISGEFVHCDWMTGDNANNLEERSAARIIMGELHCMQRLVKLLCARLEQRMLKQAQDEGIATSGGMFAATSFESTTFDASQMSPGIFKQMHTEINGRFRAVSRSFIQCLRVM